MKKAAANTAAFLRTELLKTGGLEQKGRKQGPPRSDAVLFLGESGNAAQSGINHTQVIATALETR